MYPYPNASAEELRHRELVRHIKRLSAWKGELGWRLEEKAEAEAFVVELRTLAVEVLEFTGSAVLPTDAAEALENLDRWLTNWERLVAYGSELHPLTQEAMHYCMEHDQPDLKAFLARFAELEARYPDCQGPGPNAVINALYHLLRTRNRSGKHSTPPSKRAVEPAGAQLSPSSLTPDQRERGLELIGELKTLAKEAAAACSEVAAGASAETLLIRLRGAAEAAYRFAGADPLPPAAREMISAVECWLANPERVAGHLLQKQERRSRQGEPRRKLTTPYPTPPAKAPEPAPERIPVDVLLSHLYQVVRTRLLA